MSKHPKDRAERLEVKKKKDKLKTKIIKSFRELVEHMNSNLEAEHDTAEAIRPRNKGITDEDDNG